MAENLNKVNIILVIFIFLNIFTSAEIKEEYIPVLIWTSPDFRNRKDIDNLALSKIKSDLFEFYLHGILWEKKPAIVIFLEQVLGNSDFDWRDENGNNAYPFLTELTLASKLDYFREVETPYETLNELSKKRYVWNYFKIGQKLNAKEGDVLLVEFRKIDDNRLETLKNHDKVMEEFTQQLINSGKSWICVYTARHLNVRVSSWDAEEEFVKSPTKALSLYHDEHTGYTLLTRGSIELHIPSLKNPIFRQLDSYLRASATCFQRKINFVIWFVNYKLTFYLHQENHEWLIKEIKIMNDNGDTLNLKAQEETLNKCYPHIVEFKSWDHPKVKVKIPKYKFFKLPAQESCIKPYGVELMAAFISFFVVFVVIFWSSVLENYNFSTESKVVKVPSDKIF